MLQVYVVSRSRVSQPRICIHRALPDLRAMQMRRPKPRSRDGTRKLRARGRSGKLASPFGVWMSFCWATLVGCSVGVRPSYCPTNPFQMDVRASETPFWGGTILYVFGYDDVMMRSFFMFSFDFFVTMFSCDDALNLPLIGP
jgi:hypothetical protein